MLGARTAAYENRVPEHRRATAQPVPAAVVHASAPFDAALGCRAPDPNRRWDRSRVGRLGMASSPDAAARVGVRALARRHDDQPREGRAQRRSAAALYGPAATGSGFGRVVARRARRPHQAERPDAIRMAGSDGADRGRGFVLLLRVLEAHQLGARLGVRQQYALGPLHIERLTPVTRPLVAFHRGSRLARAPRGGLDPAARARVPGRLVLEARAPCVRGRRDPVPPRDLADARP